MPAVIANGLKINYDQQGSGEPLILIPYLAADHACYAFQVAEYAKHFTCISIDLPGTGESDKRPGAYSIESLSDDVAAFMQAAGIARAHVSGLSLGAAVGMWLAAKHPGRVASLSLHSPWTHSDPFVKSVVRSWQVMAGALGSVAETIIVGIFPWCFTPELYTARGDYLESLCQFVRSRPAQSVDDFVRQSNAVMNHDVRSVLDRIVAPTLATFGSRDVLTSARFAEPMKANMSACETLVFQDCAHAALYEQTGEFNERTLRFLLRHAGKAAPVGV